MRIPFYTAWKERRAAEIKRREGLRKWANDWDRYYGAWLIAMKDVGIAHAKGEDMAPAKKRMDDYAAKIRVLLDDRGHL